MRQVFFCILMSCMLMACQNNDPNKVSIALSETMVTMQPATSTMLTATVKGSTSEVQWTSSDSAVATVWNGVVTAVKEGVSIIRATVDGVHADCSVIVTSSSGGLSLNKTSLQMVVKDTCTLVATGGTEALVWKSANEKVVTVSPMGLITAVDDGKTTVTVSSGSAVATCTVIVTQQGGSYMGEYVLVWEDEFNGTALDTSNWNIEVNGSGGGNNEKQYYTNRSDNIRVQDGMLIIEAKKENYQGKEYTSGRINSKGKHQFPYGKFEARVWLPSGGGTWPAFWMLGTKGGWPTCGEIDIMEHVGNQPTMISHALHTRMKNGNLGNNWSNRQYMDGVENNWHVFGIEWLQFYMFGRDAIRFYVDDKVSTVVTESTETRDIEQWPFFFQSDYQNYFYVIINLALGGSMGGSINNDIFNNPVLMKVDWVRAYQKKM